MPGVDLLVARPGLRHLIGCDGSAEALTMRHQAIVATEIEQIFKA